MDKTLRVDMDALIFAMTTSQDDPAQHYLDRETGDVVDALDPEMAEDDVDDPALELLEQDPERFERIPVLDGREEYRWMEEFARSVEESDLRERLLDALNGKGAFRRFRDAIGSYPDLENRWRVRLRKHHLDAAVEWMRGLEIEAVARKPDIREARPQQSAPVDDDRVDLLDFLLLGSEKTELLEGKVWKHFEASSAKEARRFYEAIARDICAYTGIGWRKLFVEKDHFIAGRIELRLDGMVVELSLQMSRKRWDSFRP